jgi:hypothetical protein
MIISYVLNAITILQLPELICGGDHVEVGRRGDWSKRSGSAHSISPEFFPGGCFLSGSEAKEFLLSVS